MKASGSSVETFDWALIRTFLAVLDTGSLLGAARQLGLSQPTAGRHIDMLESLASKLVAGPGGEAGLVRLSAARMLSLYLLPDCMAELQAQSPGIDIALVASDEVSNLLRREAGIAIRMVRPAQSSLIACRLGSMPIVACARRDYLEWMKDMNRLSRRNGNQHLHRQSKRYRDAIKRKLHAYHVFLFMGLVTQGLMYYLAACHTDQVWSSLGSWLRTIRKGVAPSERVVSTAMRNTLWEFLLAECKTSNLAKFIIERQRADNSSPFGKAAYAHSIREFATLRQGCQAMALQSRS